jgi:hypothetical protein
MVDFFTRLKLAMGQDSNIKKWQKELRLQKPNDKKTQKKCI